MMKVLGALVVLILLFVGFVATRPAHYRVERKGTIAAAPAVVQAQVENFHAWEAWSPWEKLDPAMKRDFSGAEQGVGAAYHWVGNDKVGEGSMTITDSKPDEKTGIRLEFLKPFKSTCATTFTYGADAGGTNVSWVMEGENDFIGKAFCLFMDMDKTVGGDFEKGLAQLKTVCEQMAPPDAATTAPADSTH